MGRFCAVELSHFETIEGCWVDQSLYETQMVNQIDSNMIRLIRTALIEFKLVVNPRGLMNSILRSRAGVVLGLVVLIVLFQNCGKIQMDNAGMMSIEAQDPMLAQVELESGALNGESIVSSEAEINSKGRRANTIVNQNRGGANVVQPAVVLANSRGAPVVPPPGPVAPAPVVQNLRNQVAEVRNVAQAPEVTPEQLGVQCSPLAGSMHGDVTCKSINGRMPSYMQMKKLGLSCMISAGASLAQYTCVKARSSAEGIVVGSARWMVVEGGHCRAMSAGWYMCFTPYRVQPADLAAQIKKLTGRPASCSLSKWSNGATISTERQACSVN